MHVEKHVWGGLSTFVAHDIAPGRAPELAVVLCHGFGASALDLAGLTQAFAVVKPELLARIAFIYPAAPLDLSEMGMPGGRAWWMIDLERLLNRPTPELLARFRRDPPEGLSEARGMLSAMLDEAGRHFGLSVQRFVLGGFSQGSMLATDLALRLPLAPAGLCILSGALVNEIEWRVLAHRRGQLPVFQSHGRQDAILTYPQASALCDLLTEAGLDVEFVPFPGQHEIPPLVIHKLAAFLERRLSRTQ
jgi:phospholipase/carboxylesterase